jgi:WD40 repeat protein
VRCLTYLKDGRIASGSADQNFKIWEEKNNNFICIQSVVAHHSEILDIIQLKDGRIITCGKDSTIRVWQEDGIKKGFSRKEVLIWKNGIMFE